MLRHLTPLLLTCAVATAICGSAHADSGAAERYQGRWNYDLPDQATMTNIAVMNIGDGIQGPQIGDIVFTATGPDRVVGRTDVGCTWRFKSAGDALVLDGANQTCHNPLAGYAYTMTEWTVRVDGDHETESIKAISHHGDRDYEFDLARGARTRTGEDDPAATAAFTGTWAYGAPDPKSGANIRMSGGAAAPQTGTITVVANYDDRITARTDDGCEWTMVTRGDTAKLDPPVQTCTIADSAVTLRYWTIVSDGHRQISGVYGTDPGGAAFSIAGDLHRA